MRAFFAVVLLCLWGCGPSESFQPFIHVTVVDQEGLTAPTADRFEVTLSSVLNGNPITDVLEYEVSPENNSLPLDFVVLFSEQVRGQNVDVVVRGLAGGIGVFTATTSATAGIAEVEAVARFCGDQTVDDDRQEQCDDGASNSDITPDTCRTSCQFAFCGDAVIDATEQCDDGLSNSDTTPDACRLSCEEPSCGDSVIDAAEQCDDGPNNSDTTPNACRVSCVVATCGDGVLDTGEECDDGNTIDNDGCDSDCVETTITQIATGLEHTCVLFRTGGVRCWGSDVFGQLGYPGFSNIGDNESPLTAGDVNVGGIVTQLAAGGFHTCALLNTGNVRCWGNGSFGQLGYGNTNNVDGFPASAGDVNVGGAVIQIAAGGTHTCALLETGNVRCWGNGSNGRLGYGNSLTIGDNEVPASAGNVNIGGAVIQITAGDAHTCALRSTGVVQCWGAGAAGRLGYGNTNNIGDNETPSSAGFVSVGGTAIQVSAGKEHTCALLNTGNVRCWGSGLLGKLGYANTSDIGDNEDPSSAGNINIGANVTRISAGGFHTCALLSTGNIRCWGEASFGQLGYGNTSDIGDNETPATAGNVNLGGAVNQVVTGENYTCALLSAGSVRCWGKATSGQLGYGNQFNIGDDESVATAGDVSIF